MYISSVKLWNFRKYGKCKDITEDTEPNLIVSFNKGLNVLIGENDSGKSAILDAIKLVLKTHAYEWIKVNLDDFHLGTSKLRIEIIFRGLKVNEARHFTEWLGWDNEEDQATMRPLLRLIYHVEHNQQRIMPAEVCAGMDFSGIPLNAYSKEYLKTTYLKALRDADSELSARRNSRISQILQGHELLKDNQDTNHIFKEIIGESNSEIKKWFDNPNNYTKIKKIIEEFVKAFVDDETDIDFILSDPSVLAVLEKLSIGITNNTNPGLGTLNRLYMAVELLHLRKENWDGVNICLIEELEAHLHPQAQLKVIDKLGKESNVQFILTTHSPNITSQVPLESLIICKNNQVFPMGKSYTQLEKNNYTYLERFLDVTKSNLFFAKGVIIVEGWSEQILVPIIAKRAGYDLTKEEVSIVNVGSTAYLHFAKIFLRKDKANMNVPISVISDLDNRPDKNGVFTDNPQDIAKKESIDSLVNEFKETGIKLYYAKEWTLEWCLYQSQLSNLFQEAVAEVHSKTPEFKINIEDKKKTYNPSFKEKFISKLKKESGTSHLDKLSIASTLGDKIEVNEFSFKENDDYIDYIIKAIKHACSYGNTN